MNDLGFSALFLSLGMIIGSIITHSFGFEHAFQSLISQFFGVWGLWLAHTFFGFGETE